MEKTATRKVIGILSAIALVIIILPVIINGNPHTAALQTAEVKAPPFPEPQSEIDSIANGHATAQAAPQTFASTPVMITALEAKEEIEKAQQQALEVAETNADALALANQSNRSESVLIVDHKGGVSVVKDGTVQAKTRLTINTKALPKAAKTVTAMVPANVLSGSISNVKKVAWVVQMGSFKNKDNALRLTNKLRAQGYKAFTHNTKNNGITCVYVGPEFQQASATQLVERITREVNLPGVVVKYNPLEL